MFKEHKNGLYYHDTNDGKMRSKGDEEAVALVETVSGNATHFTKRQLVAAKEARHLQSMIGRPSNKDFKVLITGNMLRNCPVTVEAIDIAEKVFGPDVASLKGKTTRAKSPVVRSDIIPVPLQ